LIHFYKRILLMNYHGGMRYPLMRREMFGPYGEVRYSLVDVKNGDVVAFWVEREADSGWGEDCYYSVDENANTSSKYDGKKVDNCSVYVGNLELTVSKEELVQCFGVVGEILRVTLLRSSKKDVKTGSAFIKFAENDAAARALYLDGFILRGIKIKVMEKLVNDETEEDKSKYSEVDPFSVFISNLDKRMTSLDLTEFLQQAGITNKVTLLRNKDTGEQKGMAYAQFSDRESCEKALSFDGSFVGGKYVKIRRKRKAGSRDEDEPSGSNKRARKDCQMEEGDPQVYEVSSIYVGNLDPRTEKGDLEEHFKNCGDIARVSILKGKSAAYIEFKDSWSVQGALCMNGSKLKDKEILVKKKLLKVS